MNYACIRHNVSCYLSYTIEFNGISCKLSSTKHPATAASKTGSFHIPHIQNSQCQFNQQKLYLWNLKFIHQGSYYGHQKENSVSEFLTSFSITPGWMQSHPSDRQCHWKITSTTAFPNTNRGFRVLTSEYNNMLPSSFLSDDNHVSPLLENV